MVKIEVLAGETDSGAPEEHFGEFSRILSEKSVGPVESTEEARNEENAEKTEKAAEKAEKVEKTAETAKVAEIKSKTATEAEKSPAREQKTKKQVEFATQNVSDEGNVFRYSGVGNSRNSHNIVKYESEHSEDYDFTGIFPESGRKLIGSNTPLVDTPVMDELDAEHSFSRATATTATTVGDLARSAFSAGFGVFTRSFGMGGEEGDESDENAQNENNWSANSGETPAGPPENRKNIPSNLAVSFTDGVQD